MPIHTKDDPSFESSKFRTLRGQFDRCYHEISRMAHNKLRRESSATIDTSALVHEVYIKMQHQHRLPRDKQQFLAVAAIVMRRYLVDYARLKQRQKRGGDQVQLTFGTLNQPVYTTPEQILKLDEALKAAGLKDKVVLIMGGAAVKKEDADTIGALFGKNKEEGVELAKKAIAEKK